MWVDKNKQKPFRSIVVYIVRTPSFVSFFTTINRTKHTQSLQCSLNLIHAASYVTNSSGISMVQCIEFGSDLSWSDSVCATIAIIIYSAIQSVNGCVKMATTSTPTVAKAITSSSNKGTKNKNRTKKKIWNEKELEKGMEISKVICISIRIANGKSGRGRSNRDGKALDPD